MSMVRIFKIIFLTIIGFALFVFIATVTAFFIDRGAVYFFVPKSIYISFDKKAKFEFSVCDFNTYKIENYEVDRDEDELKKKIFDTVRSLSTFRHYSKMYPPVAPSYYVSYQYNHSEFIKAHESAYSFAKNLKSNSIVLRVYVSDGAVELFTAGTARKYNIYFDICNNDILHIDY